MKKLISLLLILGIILSLAACGGGKTQAGSGAPDSGSADSPSSGGQSGISPAPELSDEELAAEVDRFINENVSFLSYSWPYLSADEIAGGALSRLNANCLGDIVVDAELISYGYYSQGYVLNEGRFLEGEEGDAIVELFKKYSPLFCGVSCRTFDLQEAFDRFYGKNRFDVTTWTGNSQDERLVHEHVSWINSTGTDMTLLLSQSFFEGNAGVMFERGDIARDGDMLAVTCYAVEWYMDENGIKVSCMNAEQTELASGLDWDVVNLNKGAIDVTMVYVRGNLEDFISDAGISRERIAPIRLILYWGDDGALHLWGVDRTTAAAAFTPDSEAPAAAAQNEAPAVSELQNQPPSAPTPEVVPDALGSEVMRTVSASGGLRMRQGPDTNYDYIQMIPDGAAVPSYAEQGGWYYVLYSGCYGWVSGEYCS